MQRIISTRSNRYRRGLGLVAIIIIVAVIAVGGYAAVQVTERGGFSFGVDEEEVQKEIRDAKEDARNRLVALRADVETGVSASVETTLGTLASIRADLAEAYTGANAEVRAELQALEAKLDRIEAEIDARSARVADAIDEAIASLEATFETENNANVQGGASTGTQTDTTGGGGAGSVEGGASSDADAGAGGSSGEVDVDAEVDASGSVDLRL